MRPKAEYDNYLPIALVACNYCC